MFLTGNPVADAERYHAEQDRKLDMLPKCSCCNEPITTEKAIYYNDQWCCRSCEQEFWEDIREDFEVEVEI